MENLREAAVLNNAGVHNLQNGNYREGFAAIHQALLASRRAAEQRREPPLELPSVEDVEIVEGSIIPALHCFRERSRRLLEHHNGCLYIYDRAVVLPVDADPSTTADQREWHGHFAHCSIIFNLALACHQKGVARGRESFLTRAIRLYSLIVHILEAIGENTHDNASLGVLKCLALNNCATIHYEQCDYASSGECFEALGNELGYLSTSCHLETCLDCAEVQALLRNVEHSNPPSMAGSA